MSTETATPAPAPAPTAEGEKVINVEVKGKEKPKRSFTVLTVHHDEKKAEFQGGRYQSFTPSGAARKAASEACKSLAGGSDDPITVEIVIKEVTRNRASKPYAYEATRKLSEKEVNFAGSSGTVKIPFKWSISLKSLKKNDKGQTVAEGEKEEVPADETTVTEDVKA